MGAMKNGIDEIGWRIVHINFKVILMINYKVVLGVQFIWKVKMVPISFINLFCIVGKTSCVFFAIEEILRDTRNHLVAVQLMKKMQYFNMITLCAYK